MAILLLREHCQSTREKGTEIPKPTSHEGKYLLGDFLTLFDLLREFSTTFVEECAFIEAVIASIAVMFDDENV